MGQVPELGRFVHGSLWLFPAPQKASEGQDHELDSRQRAEAVGDTHHVNARHLLYPDSHVTRFPVPNEKVPWDVSTSLGWKHLGFWGVVLPRALLHSRAPGRLVHGSPPGDVLDGGHRAGIGPAREADCPTTSSHLASPGPQHLRGAVAAPFVSGS